MHAQQGLSMVEMAVALAVTGILVSAAWPSHLAHLKRMRRLDATTALTRLQHTQEQHRLRTGDYAGQLPGSSGGTLSPQGLYELSLQPQGPGRVTLVARARPDADQGRDHDCPVITLTLNEGVADAGPNARCWGR